MSEAQYENIITLAERFGTSAEVGIRAETTKHKADTPFAMQNLQEKVVVITGAASGIGRAMAHTLTKRVARRRADIQTDPLKATEQEIVGFGGEAKVLAVGVDVDDPNSEAALAQATLDRSRAVLVACHNAGGQSLRPILGVLDRILEMATRR